jgi:hypothetical protein
VKDEGTTEIIPSLTPTRFSTSNNNVDVKMAGGEDADYSQIVDVLLT